MIHRITLVLVDVFNPACKPSVKWNCTLLFVFLNLYWNCYIYKEKIVLILLCFFLMLRETLTMDIQQHCQSVSVKPRFSFSYSMFFQKLSLPLCINSCFQILFNFVISTSFITKKSVISLVNKLTGGSIQCHCDDLDSLSRAGAHGWAGGAFAPQLFEGESVWKFVTNR